MKHICVSRLTITGSDNGLSPGRRQAIMWTNAGILLIGPLGTNFSENLIEILTFSFTKIRLKVSSAKRWPFCLDLNVLIIISNSLLYPRHHKQGWVVFLSKLQEYTRHFWPTSTWHGSRKKTRKTTRQNSLSHREISEKQNCVMPQRGAWIILNLDFAALIVVESKKSKENMCFLYFSLPEPLWRISIFCVDHIALCKAETFQHFWV